MSRFIKICLTAIALSAAGCSPDYSPNTYNSNAVQQANKVEQGVVVGVREVGVKAAGTTGAVTGGAAGGIVGSQTPGGSVATAFGTLGGTLVGGKCPGLEPLLAAGNHIKNGACNDRANHLRDDVGQNLLGPEPPR